MRLVVGSIEGSWNIRSLNIGSAKICLFLSLNGRALWLETTWSSDSLAISLSEQAAAGKPHHRKNKEMK